jgi:hypothetical protein
MDGDLDVLGRIPVESHGRGHSADEVVARLDQPEGAGDVETA